MAINQQGRRGFQSRHISGPFLSFSSFANHLSPQVVLEVYFYAKRKGNTFGHIGDGGGPFLLTLAIATGILITVKLMWFLRL